MNGGRFQGDLPDRTFEFGAQILDVVDQIPSCTKGWVVAKQLARCGTSVGANVCEGDEALSENEFIYRCGVARKESSEARYWLRQSVRANLLQESVAQPLISESDELVRILTAIVKKTQQRQAANSVR